MNKDEILDNLMKVSHEPFLVFANRVEEKTDNALETLKLLAKETNVTPGRISEYLDIKPSSVTQIIKKLEKATAKKQKLFSRNQKATEERDHIIRKEGEINGFYLPRLNMFLGKPLTHSGVYPDGVIRLFKS